MGDHIYSYQLRNYTIWYGSVVVGLIIHVVSISELFVTNFSEIFWYGVRLDWLAGINLASFILPYPVIFDNLIIYRKYCWVIFHRSIFSFYYVS